MNAALSTVDKNTVYPISIGQIVEPIIPAVLNAKARPNSTVRCVITHRAPCTVHRLTPAEPSMIDPIKASKLMGVGASYDLNNGKVDFFIESCVCGRIEGIRLFPHHHQRLEDETVARAFRPRSLAVGGRRQDTAVPQVAGAHSFQKLDHGMPGCHSVPQVTSKSLSVPSLTKALRLGIDRMVLMDGRETLMFMLFGLWRLSED